MIAKNDAYEICQPVHNREMSKYQALIQNVDESISKLALTCDCLTNIDNLNQYNKMITLERKLKRVFRKKLKENKLNWIEQKRFEAFVENARTCQIFMKYEFMRKYLGFLF